MRCCLKAPEQPIWRGNCGSTSSSAQWNWRPSRLNFMRGIITRVDGARVTRLEMLQFVKEHELTHRAQLFLYMRMKGIVPATTRRRLACRPLADPPNAVQYSCKHGALSLNVL